MCVVGNKADLLDDIKVHFKEANDKCLALDNHIIYFHVSSVDSSQVIHCFWDIISRPLIYKHVVRKVIIGRLEVFLLYVLSVMQLRMKQGSFYKQ